MKKLLLLITALFLFASVEGQILRYSNYTAPAPPTGGDYNFQVDRYIAGLSTPLNDSVTEKINTFVVALCDSLNIDSLAQVFDVMYVLANGNSEAALRNLVKRDHDATNVSSTSFTAFEGFTGDGTADYLNTNYAPSSEAVNFTQNNASIGAYIRTNVESDVQIDVGVRYGGVDILIYGDYPSIGSISRVNVESSRIDAATTTSVGLVVATRDGAAISNQVFYRNKTTPTQSASGSASTSTIPLGDIFILANNNGGTAGDFSTRQISLVFAGEHITTAMRDDIVDCFEAYMDSNGKGVL